MEFLRNMFGGETKRQAEIEAERNKQAERERNEQLKKEITQAFERVTDLVIAGSKHNGKLSDEETRELTLILKAYVRGQNRPNGNKFGDYAYSYINNPIPGENHSPATIMATKLNTLKLFPGFKTLADESLISLCNTYDSTGWDNIQWVTKSYLKEPRKMPEKTWSVEGVEAEKALKSMHSSWR